MTELNCHKLSGWHTDCHCRNPGHQCKALGGNGLPKMTKTEYEAYPRACESGSQFGRVIQKVFPDATQKFYRIGNKLNVTLKKG